MSFKSMPTTTPAVFSISSFPSTRKLADATYPFIESRSNFCTIIFLWVEDICFVFRDMPAWQSLGDACGERPPLAVQALIFAFSGPQTKFLQFSVAKLSTVVLTSIVCQDSSHRSKPIA